MTEWMGRIMSISPVERFPLRREAPLDTEIDERLEAMHVVRPTRARLTEPT